MTAENDIKNWQNLPDDFYLTVKDVMGIARCSRNSVMNYIHNENLPAFKPFGTYLVKKKDLVEFLENSRVQKIHFPKNKQKQRRGQPFKHIRPTWLPEPSPPLNAPLSEKNECNAQSSGCSYAP